MSIKATKKADTAAKPAATNKAAVGLLRRGDLLRRYTQCAIKTGSSAWERMCWVAPPNINRRKRSEPREPPLN
jgi:hypothetical protein